MYGYQPLNPLNFPLHCYDLLFEAVAQINDTIEKDPTASHDLYLILFLSAYVYYV